MKYKTIYKFSSEKNLTLINEQNNALTIEQGNILQFSPNFSMKKQNDYQLIIKKKELYVINVSAEVAKKLVEQSKVLKQKITTYQLDIKEQNAYKIYEDVHSYLSKLAKELSSKDISANHKCVNELLSEAKQHLNHLYKEKNPSGEFSQKASEFFKNTDKIIETAKQCTETNQKTENYHKYIKDLEQCCLNHVIFALHWTNTEKPSDLDFHMVEVGISDAMDVLKIALNLNYNYVAQAYEATSLDTAVRETLPNDFWSDWVLEQDISILRKYEQALIQSEKLHEDLPKKSTTSNKIKV